MRLTCPRANPFLTLLGGFYDFGVQTSRPWSMHYSNLCANVDFPGSPLVIVCASTAEGVGSIPGWGTKILHAVWCGRKKNGVCQCAFYSMDRGAWQAAIHGVAKSRTQLSDY